MIHSRKSITKFRNLFLEESQLRYEELFKLYGVSGIEELLRDEIPKQRTQQLTSIISPLNEDILRIVSRKFPQWKFEGRKGSDSVYDGVPLEHKLSLSDSPVWTGHWYSRKTPLHLLMKIKFEGNRVCSICMFLINLSECSKFSQWSQTPSKTNSFSNLRIHVSDIDKIIPIFGEMKPCRIWCKPQYEII